MEAKVADVSVNGFVRGSFTRYLKQTNHKKMVNDESRIRRYKMLIINSAKRRLPKTECCSSTAMSLALNICHGNRVSIVVRGGSTVHKAKGDS
jgi:hypothetical protein